MLLTVENVPFDTLADSTPVALAPIAAAAVIGAPDQLRATVVFGAVTDVLDRNVEPVGSVSCRVMGLA